MVTTSTMNMTTIFWSCTQNAFFFSFLFFYCFSDPLERLLVFWFTDKRTGSEQMNSTSLWSSTQFSSCKSCSWHWVSALSKIQYLAVYKIYIKLLKVPHCYLYNHKGQSLTSSKQNLKIKLHCYTSLLYLNLLNLCLPHTAQLLFLLPGVERK